MTTPPRRPSSASRATRRSRRPAAGSTPFLQRNRTRILWIAGLVGFLLLASAFYVNASRPSYSCVELFDPTPAPSAATPGAATPGAATPGAATPGAATQAPPTTAPTPAGSAQATTAPTPGGSPLPTLAPATPQPPGYVQLDQGAGHVDVGSTVRYPSCPPASGKHYNPPPAGPIRGGFYGAGDNPGPPGWIHNLEHGAIVLLYRCTTPGSDEPAEACTDAGQQALRDLLSRWPNSPYCDLAPGQLTPVIARFDDMAWPYAAVVWNVILPMETLDEAALFDFYEKRGERFNPEPQCADPTPTPGPATPTPAVSPGASGAASPGTSPAASPGTASPGTSPGGSPIPSAAGSTAPAAS